MLTISSDRHVQGSRNSLQMLMLQAESTQHSGWRRRHSGTHPPAARGFGMPPPTHIAKMHRPWQIPCCTPARPADDVHSYRKASYWLRFHAFLQLTTLTRADAHLLVELVLCAAMETAAVKAMSRWMSSAVAVSCRCLWTCANLCAWSFGCYLAASTRCSRRSEREAAQAPSANPPAF